MPRRRHHARREPRREVYRFYTFLAGITVLILGAGCFFFSSPHKQLRRSLWESILALNARSLRQGKEKEASGLIYPYSIVAGGVHNPQELREAVNTDPVAAAHYSGFNLSNGRVIKLQDDRYAYVSFRVGDNIYWTSHKLRLQKGETLLTDGEHYIRTRCGNLLSKDARLPIYRHEPSASILNTPLPGAPDTEAHVVAELGPIAFLPGPSARPSLSLAPPGHAFESAKYAPPAYTPFLPLSIEPGCTQKNSQEKHCGASQNSPPPPPLAPTPENNMWILFLSGTAIFAVYWIVRGKTGIVQP